MLPYPAVNRIDDYYEFDDKTDVVGEGAFGVVYRSAFCVSCRLLRVACCVLSVGWYALRSSSASLGGVLQGHGASCWTLHDCLDSVFRVLSAPHFAKAHAPPTH